MQSPPKSPPQTPSPMPSPGNGPNYSQPQPPKPVPGPRTGHQVRCPSRGEIARASGDGPHSQGAGLSRCQRPSDTENPMIQDVPKIGRVYQLTPGTVSPTRPAGRDAERHPARRGHLRARQARVSSWTARAMFARCRYKRPAAACSTPGPRPSASSSHDPPAAIRSRRAVLPLPASARTRPSTPTGSARRTAGC